MQTKSRVKSELPLHLSASQIGTEPVPQKRSGPMCTGGACQSHTQASCLNISPPASNSCQWPGYDSSSALLYDIPSNASPDGWAAKQHLALSLSYKPRLYSTWLGSFWSVWYPCLLRAKRWTIISLPREAIQKLNQCFINKPTSYKGEQRATWRGIYEMTKKIHKSCMCLYGLALHS